MWIKETHTHDISGVCKNVRVGKNRQKRQQRKEEPMMNISTRRRIYYQRTCPSGGYGNAGERPERQAGFLTGTDGTAVRFPFRGEAKR